MAYAEKRMSGNRQRARKPVFPVEIRKVPHIWVLVADDHVARIFSKQGSDISFVAEIMPAERETVALTNKSVGRVASSSTASIHHKYEPRFTRSQKDMFSFARRVSTWLEDEAGNGSFERLVLIAPPRMLGNLRKALSPHVGGFVIAEFGKDYTKTDELRLRDELRKMLALH